jgi:alpha-mannosidase
MLAGMPTIPTPNRLPQLSLSRLQADLGRIQARCWQRLDPAPVEGSRELTEVGGVERARGLTWAPLSPGETYGLPRQDWRQRWFRLAIPAATAEQAGRRHLVWKANGESTVHIDGTAWAGLDCAHPSCRLPDAAAELLIETCLWQTAIWAPTLPISSTGQRFEGAWIGVRDEAAWKLYHDLHALVAVAKRLHGRSGAGNSLEGGRHHHQPSLISVPPLLRRLIEELSAAIRAFDEHGVSAAQAVADRCYAELRSTAWAGDVVLLGHSHLDLVWLWPERATRRKWVHTAATVAGLMERDPAFTFINSQPWLLPHLEADDPRLAARVRRFIAEGRWELEGMAEVESDVLLSGGETLARSLVRGQRRIAALRGRMAGVMWIPDVFGYCGCLPQLVRLAGGRGFFTSKLTWSRVTPFPYTSFVWEGDDGTSVVAHLPPVGFNGNASVDELCNAAEDHRQAGVAPALLAPIGYGDGAGGPTEEHLERARRLADLAGVPRARWGTCEAFFDALESVADRLPRFRGELYLEAHRGTPIVQVRMKQAFRASERALQAWEAAAAVSGSGPLPDDAWERTVFASFHDAIPGSSIGAVYEELVPQLAAAAQEARSRASASLGGAGDCWFNPLPVAWSGLLPGADGPVPVRLPALAASTLAAARITAAAPAWDGTVLANGRVRAVLAGDGLHALVIDGVEQPLSGPAGLWLHEDHPHQHDAWETDLDDRRDGRPVSLGAPSLVLQNAAQVEVAQAVRIASQDIGRLVWGLDAGSAALDVRLEVDWQQQHRLLRFVVPTRHLGRMARFGGPFGCALRCQLPGYEQDEARWDGAGSRWAAVTDETADDGLAIVSQASYGFSAYAGALAINLLRAPANPDPGCDRGAQRIAFQLRAWRARSAEGPTALDAETAYAEPVPCAAPRSSLAAWSDLGGLVPSWVEPVSDGIVLRAHETAGCDGAAELTLAVGLGAPEPVDLLGRPLAGVAAPTALGGGRWRVPYRARQILSLRCRRG